MSKNRNRLKARQCFSWFVAGGLVGAGLALCYAPSRGEEIRDYLELKSEIARAKAAQLANRASGSVTSFIKGMKRSGATACCS